MRAFPAAALMASAVGGAVLSSVAEAQPPGGPSTRGLAVSVSTTGSCPSAAAIAAHLHGLVASSGQVRAHAHVEELAEGMMVHAAASTGPPWRRHIPARGVDCDRRARLVALVLGAWLGPSAPAAPPATGVGSRSGRAPVERPSPPVVRSPEGERLSVGAGMLGSADAAGRSLGARVEVFGTVSRRWLVGASASIFSSREVALGPGTVRWRRPQTSLSLGSIIGDGPARLHLDGGPVLGLLLVEGRGFDQNKIARTSSLGAHAGVRVDVRSAGPSFWMDLRGVLWPRAQHVRNEIQPAGPTRTTRLPSWDLQLGVGVSFFLRRW